MVKAESIPYLKKSGRPPFLGETKGDRSKPEGNQCDYQLELKSSKQKVSQNPADFCGITSTMPPCNKQEGSSSNTQD